MSVLGALARLWKSRRSRIIIYAILTGLVCGAANLLLPAEDLLIDARAAIRRHTAPQDITVVAIDDNAVVQRSLGVEIAVDQQVTHRAGGGHGLGEREALVLVDQEGLVAVPRARQLEQDPQ